MPTLTLKLTPPPADPTHLQALAATLTELTAEILGKAQAVTAVLVEPVPAAQWFIGGHAAQRPTALLELVITAGTNTAAQKARFIAAAFDALEREIAPGLGLEPASYVQVRELQMDDWGYGGRTQAERRREREAA